MPLRSQERRHQLLPSSPRQPRPPGRAGAAVRPRPVVQRVRPLPPLACSPGPHGAAGSGVPAGEAFALATAAPAAAAAALLSRRRLVEATVRRMRRLQQSSAAPLPYYLSAPLDEQRALPPRRAPRGGGRPRRAAPPPPPPLLQLLAGESVCHRLLAAPDVHAPLAALHSLLGLAQ
jgi:hypothetical protein